MFSGPFYINSKNYRKFYIGSKNGKDYKITREKEASKVYIVSPGLTGKRGTISFESAEKPGYFLRHYGFHISLETKATARNPAIFEKDATFQKKTDKFNKGFVSFESTNYPGRYIRHQGYRLKISKQDKSQLFKDDASWKVVQNPGIL